MGVEEIIDKQVKALNDHDPNTWAGFYADNAVVHDPQYPQPLRGRDSVRQDLADFVRAFPDLEFRVINKLVSGDRAAVEGVGTGTQDGPIQSPTGTIPATHKRVNIPFSAHLRFDASGRITEERRYYDLAGLLQQLGMTPQ
jgi:steroid delta-isomerase-like uncharacterized protein